VSLVYLKLYQQIRGALKFFIISGLAALSMSCGGGGSSSSGGGSTPPGPTPVQEQAVNISNISAIPVTGNQTTTSLTVANNTNFNLHLTGAVIAYGSETATLNLAGENNTFAGVVNVTQCGTLQANGTCGVVVAPPNANGSYLITLTFTTDNGARTFTSSQVVTYSRDIPATTGFIYSNLNNNVYVPEGGRAYMTIPFIIDHDTTTLYVYSNNPGAFVTSLNCPGGTTYQRGDLCTAIVQIGNLGTTKDIIGIITVSDDPNPHPLPSGGANQSVKKIKALAGSTGYSFSTPVSVTSNSVGNLVTSAFNPVISPANGSAPVTITLLNNGVASLTLSNLSVASGSPVTVAGSGGTPCVAGTVLAANGSCTYQVNANTTTSGQSAGYIGYNNGSSSAQLIYTVVYISATPGPGMSLTAAQGSLQNAVVGTTSTLTVNVTNTGTTALTNVTFSALPTIGTGTISYNSAGTCATNGTQALAVGAKCTLLIDYLPSSAQSTAQFNLSAIATYTDQGGQSQTYSGAYLVVQYSAFTGNAFVYLVPNYTSYAIRADNTDTASQIITLVNSGGRDTTLANPAYTTSGFPSSGVAVNSTACNGFTLTANGGATCNIIITYGPVAATQSSTSGRLNISYAPAPSVSNVTAFATEVFQAQAAALVSVQSIVKSGATGGAGAGTSGSPYTFINAPTAGYPIIFTITYQNTGTAAATLFSVNVNSLPVGYIISGTPTCGYGNTTSTLAASGGTCTIAITAMGASAFWNPYAYTGALNFNVPGYSYNDTNTGVNTNATPSAPTFGTTVYVTANLFSTLSGTGGTQSTAVAGGSFNVTFTSTAGTAALYPATITIPTTSLTTSNTNSIYLTSTNTCTITNPSTSSNTCTINITNNANAVAGTYTYAYWITPTGLTPSLTNSIIQYFSFTLN
jgi:hypothetical protein